MAEYSPRTKAGELQKIVESRGQKNFFFIISQTAPSAPHVVWDGFKKINPSSSKNKLQVYSVIRHD